MISSSLNDAAPFIAVRAFLLSVLPTGVEVIQAQDNGVPMPLGPFVAMNATRLTRLSTNYDAWTDTTRATVTDSQLVMQLDFYGPDSGAQATIAQTMFRDATAADAFPANIRPLSADDPVQLPLINAEGQFEQRWKLEALLQIKPAVTLDQQSALEAAIGIKSVDVEYQPVTT